ncbi:MAG: FIST C-terminal domain-containing protein [Planctomycetota bacterium]|jgi:small ligand-binding sensory domain FIST
MQASSSIQQHDSILMALGNAIQEARDTLDGDPQLLFVFVSGTEGDERAGAVLESIRRTCPGASVFGGVADSLIGRGRETESRISASVLMIRGLSEMPRGFHMECEPTPDGWSVFGIDDDVHRSAKACGGLLTIGCPKTFSAEMLYDSLEDMAPAEQSSPLVFGGNLSHSPWSDPATLFLNDRTFHHGGIALVMPPEVRWSTVVSQGCRPIGEPMVITEMDGNSILALGGKPALDRLRQTFQQLPTHEQAMAMKLLLIGQAISEYSQSFSHGEFLIRNITSIDQETKSISVAGRFQVGQTVRFHLRDADAADADLKQLMALAVKSGIAPKAGLLFSCNGRGQNMFPIASHDASVLDHYFPNLPCAGFFAAGEFGPVDQHNLVHGFTAVAAFLSDAV